MTTGFMISPSKLMSLSDVSKTISLSHCRLLLSVSLKAQASVLF